VETESGLVREDARRLLAAELPFLSVLDITYIKEELSRILGNLSFALRGIVALLFFLGMIMMIVLIQEKLMSRRLDFASLRCVGARVSWLRRAMSVELVLIAFIPSCAGLLMGGAMSGWVMDYYLNIVNRTPFGSSWMVPFIVLGCVMALSWMNSFQINKIRPRTALQGG